MMQRSCSAQRSFAQKLASPGIGLPPVPDARILNDGERRECLMRARDELVRQALWRERHRASTRPNPQFRLVNRARTPTFRNCRSQMTPASGRDGGPRKFVIDVSASPMSPTAALMLPSQPVAHFFPHRDFARDAIAASPYR
jgi:hypothetical protein